MERVYIGKELKSVMNVLKRYSQKDAEVRGIKPCDEKEGKPTMLHGMFIGYIAEKSKDGDIFQKDLEKAFNIRRSTATEVLKLMEKNGYIEKESVKYDARLKKIKLTQKGLEEHENAMKGIHIMEDKMAEGITDEEIEVLLRVLEKIKKNLSE